MGFLDKFKHVIKPVQEAPVQSIVIYNTEKNFIVLVQFNSSIWYETLEFIEAAGRANVGIAISHTANVTKSESSQSNKDEKSLEANKPVEFINQRYYLLISSSDYYLAELFDLLPLHNPILATLLQDIQANRSSSSYNSLFKYGILAKSDFHHQGIAPKYDELVKSGNSTHDDIALIMSKLPSCFSAMDIARFIGVWDKHGAGLSAIGLAKVAFNTFRRGTVKADYDEILTDVRSSLYGKILKDPSLENIEILGKPIYFWEDINADPEGEYMPDKTIEEMDEVFQQQYDRFNPMEDNQYQSIDDKVEV